MLFNSYAFIFVFLPVVLLGFFRLARVGHGYAAAWLALASLFFYGYWNPAYVGLLLGSIVGNYAFGTWIARAGAKQDERRKKSLLAIAVAADLALLGYYKYANFFVDNLNPLLGTDWNLSHIILPLGISFFTFTQIAFLVDTWQGKVREYNFVHYLLFVTYFPHLIAGPVLHHREMMPQFAHAATYRFNYENMAVGATIFFIGLFKKVVLADGLSVYVGPVFDAPAAGVTLTFVEAWGGALCYTLQLYFDFSGYSDMAIGLSRMFGVVLPLNFHSPYKAVNIIEFWRRWHMTLSRFLRDYLYIPLGGNRKGAPRRYLNLMATMLLGGLWHGAGWTFVIWGGLHGLYLVVNHAWHALRRSLGQDPDRPLSRPAHLLSVLLTFLAVVAAWVVFRADNMDAAMAMLHAMAGMNGFVLPDAWLPKWGASGQWLAAQGVDFGATNDLIMGGAINWIWISLLIVWLAPNTQQIMAGFRPALDVPSGGRARWLLWRPSLPSALAVWLIGFIAVINLNRQSAFLYFQF
ncbi:MAG: MBOAT family protein [Nitrosomonadales bacterium]|nr:MBOAT family protein [Nitrosomonadales bacterium]